MGLAIAAVAVVIAAAQLLLPVIAASVLRSRLARDGRVLSVKVSAFPALKLLWGHADSATVKLAEYGTAPSHVAGLLAEAGDVGRLNVSIETLRTDLLTLHNVSLIKHGSELTATATVDAADLRRALPVIESVTPISSTDGTLTLRGKGAAFGVSATVTAVVGARDGELVLSPSGLLGGLLQLKIFVDPRIYVQSVSGHPIPGGLTVSVRAELRS